jgi:CheY-like chemotaxis protein
MTRQGRGFRILIADDEPEVLNLVRMVLEMEDYTVFVAAEGQEALDKARRDLPDLIILDVRMPKMSGLTVLDLLRDDPATARIPVIMLSVVTTYPEVRTALQQGAVAYLSKPFELRELARLVARVLAMQADERDALRQQALANVGKAW